MKCDARTLCLLVILSLFAFKPAIAQEDELTGEIVYSSAGNIFIIDLASRSIQQLTHDGTSTYPRWSPEGETIAYVSNGDIYLMDTDGSNARQLTNVGNILWYPVWSPDGEKIAFVASEPEKTWNIFVVTIDDSQIEQLIELPAGRLYIYNDSTPNWSPDGQHLLFEVFRESGDVRGIYVLDSNTKRSHRILENYPPAGNPTWSPDGKFIAYFSYGEQSDERGLFVSGIDGNNRRRIDEFKESFGRPVWSLDNELIAYSDGMNWYYSICIALVNRDDYFGCFNDGSNVYRYPVWSPDGKYILFQQYADETDAFPGAEPLKVLDVWQGKIYPLGVNAGEYMMDWRPASSENN